MQKRYLKKNIKIIIAIFIFVFVLIITNFLINLTINKQCKSSNILSSIINLGISHIYDCSSIEGIKSNIKIALKTKAPIIPQNNTLCLFSPATSKNLKKKINTNK